MMMPGRGFSNGYRYGYNGKELDQEGMGGGGSTYDYGFRIYNPAIAKFLSIDPLTDEYPWYTPYQFAGNMPIWALDRDGAEEWYYVLEYHDGKPQLTLEKIVETRGIPGTDFFDYTPMPTVYVYWPDGGFGNRSFTFTEGGHSTGGNTIALFNAWVDNPRGFGDDGGKIGHIFNSDAAYWVGNFNKVLPYAVNGKMMAGMVPNRPVLPTRVNTQSRAQTIQNAQPNQKARNMSTASVAEAETPDGQRQVLVSSSRNRLTPAQRAALNEGEIEVAGPGHAETTILNYAEKQNLTIRSISASRPICPTCAQQIQERAPNAVIESPLKQLNRSGGNNVQIPLRQE